MEEVERIKISRTYVHHVTLLCAEWIKDGVSVGSVRKKETR